MSKKAWWKRAAELMKEEKRLRHMTQEDLADKLGVKRAAVGHYLAGRREPEIDTIIKLCEIFNVSADYLLNGRQTDYDIDDIDRKVIRLLDELAPWQIEVVMAKLEEFASQNESVRSTASRSKTRRSRFVEGIAIRRESPRVGRPTVKIDGTVAAEATRKPTIKTERREDDE